MPSPPQASSLTWPLWILAGLGHLRHAAKHPDGRAGAALGQVKHLPRVQQALEPEIKICMIHCDKRLHEVDEVDGRWTDFCISLAPWLPPDLGLRKTMRGELVERGRGFATKEV